MKYRLAAIALMASTAVSAESYNTFIDVNHVDSGDYDSTGLGITHYFGAKETRGPLDEFKFINSKSFIKASYSDSDFSKNTQVSGQWYADNGLFLGAGYIYSDFDSDLLSDSSTDAFTGTIGYQASETWSVSTTLIDVEDQDTMALFDVNYEHDLGNNDFLAFSYGTNDDTDFHRLGVRYFNTLDNGQYLVLNAGYTDYEDGDESWNLGSEWYFNNYTSVFANIGDDDTWQLGAQHYFNKTWAVRAAYGDSDNAPDSTWAVNLRAQF